MNGARGTPKQRCDGALIAASYSCYISGGMDFGVGNTKPAAVSCMTSALEGVVCLTDSGANCDSSTVHANDGSWQLGILLNLYR